ncbi:MAG: V-type ATP synthase subunit I [Oscillospiraceae bacterium]|jgi:V/A-type H+-transporting ATPase subunit I|nr:V-type ATP synthase subunit I [Oscillospiraceae bacterium]
MAIVKMKKLRLIVMRSQRDALMRDLNLLGCVEVTQPDGSRGEEELPGMPVREEDAGAESRRAQGAALRRAIDVLNRYAPEKTPMFASMREMSADDFFAGRDEERLFALAAEIDEADSRLRRLDAEEIRLLGYIESLSPWESHKLPLDCEGTKTTGLLLGAVPVSTDLEALDAAMADAAPLCEVFRVSSGREQHCLCAMFARDSRQEVADVLRSRGFVAASHKGVNATAAQAISKTREELEQLSAEREELRAKIIGASVDRQALLYMLDLTQARQAEAEASEKLIATERTATLTGWIPAASEGALRDMLSQYVCALELRDPEDDEMADVPVRLHNNPVTRPLSMVTEMYSLPAYNGVDPNPLMAPFFVLFYGFMMADMGYGLVMVLAALIVKRKKPRGGMRNFFDLLLLCGISTFVIGALTGGFFGDAPAQVAGIFGATFTLPYTPLFDPVKDTTVVLITALAFGGVQIFTGMLISFIKTTKDGHFWDALMDQGSWWLVFGGIALGALGVTWYVMIAGFVAVVLTQGRSKPTIIGKLTSGLGKLYDITGYFGDILSYSRLMALMLAGGVIAQVFNTIGALTGNIVTFLIIFIIGHALNMGLNLLGCYVHDLRLQCLEFFGKFYEDGGKPFKPLSINGKYVNITGNRL